MRKKGLTFRCPAPLSAEVETLMKNSGMSFSELMGQALHLYSRHIKVKGGPMMAPYTEKEIKTCKAIYKKIQEHLVRINQ